MKMFRVFVLLTYLGIAAGSPASTGSRVCRFTLPEAVGERWDMEVVLFHRNGGFHHGYALVGGRDNVPHRMDVTPSRPIQWQKADGTAFEVPDRMRGYYSYMLKPEFTEYKQAYESGQIKIAYPIATGAIQWSDGRLSGIVDVLIAPVNIANTTGRGPLDTAYRIRVDAKGSAGSALSGSAVWWNYDEKDDDYGADAPRTTVTLRNAHWDRNYWKPKPTSDYAETTDWPQARGPVLNGSAADCESPLIDNLDDARLLWVGEETIGGGRGAVLSRGGFAMYPYAWQNIGYGGFAGVTVADGKVFQYVVHPDEELVAADKTIAENVYVQLGADPRTMANERGQMRDTVLCLDARTGKTLWWFKSDKTFGKIKSGKGGVGMTACYYKDKVYARGSGGLYCLDADTGRLVWHKTGDKKTDTKVSYGPSGGWSHDESPVIIGRTLVMGFGVEESLAGVDPADGSLLWAHDQVKGQNAVPAKVVLEGKEYIIVCSRETAKLSLIDPADGSLLWQSTALGANHASLSVWGDIVCGNTGDRENRKQGTAAAVRVNREGARLLWKSDRAGYPPHRSVPVGHNGCFYIDDRENFFCLKAADGSIVNRLPHIYHMSWGSHNWVWTITGNNRVLTSGVLMFSTAEDGFQRLPGRISLDLAGGYTCPIKPAMADGRLFCRLADKIVCYDLRKDPARRSKTIELSAFEAFAGSLEPENPVKIRVRTVNNETARVSACWPEVVGPEAQRVAEAWANWYKKPLTWRTYPAPGLKLTENRLSGRIKLPMGWHFEHWTLNLTQDDGGFEGTYTRSVPALARPLQVRGNVSGSVIPVQEGTCYQLVLEKAATQVARSTERQPVHTAVVQKGGRLRGWAMAGKINGMSHELITEHLDIEADRIQGKVTVIFRDDPYFHLNPVEKTSVAATYKIDAAIRDDKIAGSHTGHFGHEWTRTGRIAAEMSAN